MRMVVAISLRRVELRWAGSFVRGILRLGRLGPKAGSVGREICVLDDVGNRKRSIYVGTAGEMSEVLAGVTGEIILSALSSAMVRRVAMVVDANGSELSRRGW